MKKSKILESVHDTVKGLHKLGLASAVTMKEFDALCLPKVPVLTPNQIKKLRQREKVSQPVFATFLNVSPSTVKKWETGEKHPNGAAVRLLDLFNHYGLNLVQYHEDEHHIR